MNIGNNIKYLRQLNNYTQEFVANTLGISYQAISKWETNANTPDISLLPQIANLFHVSIDTLFADDIPEMSGDVQQIKDDDVMRIVQMKGTKILKVSPISKDNMPIEIAFPRNCNNETQYFKVEVYGHVTTDSSINGDVICHQSIICGTLNGDVRANGDIKVNEINSSGNISCENIKDCYKIKCHTIECNGNVISANLTCAQITRK